MDVLAAGGGAKAALDSSVKLLRGALDFAKDQSAALLESLDPAVGRALDVQA